MAIRRIALEAAQLAEKKGSHAKAAGHYLEHLATQSDDLRSWLKLAELQERLGDHPAAGESFRRLGDLNAKQGFSSKAISALRRALKLVPDDATAALLLASALSAEGKNRDATEVLESTAGLPRVQKDRSIRIALLQRAAQLDGSARAALALAEVLADGPERKQAVDLLKQVAARLKDDRALTDQVRVQERILELSVDDLQVGLDAAAGALKLREASRALLIIRRTLDGHPEELGLYSLAAVALEAYGDKARALQVYREAARRFALKHDGNRARECWQGVLRLSPEDPEARRVLAPALLPDVAGMLARSARALNDINSDEAEGALSGLSDASLAADLGGPVAGARQALPEQSFEVDLEPIAALTLEVDQVPPGFALEDPTEGEEAAELAAPDDVEAIEEQDESEAMEEPSPAPRSGGNALPAVIVLPSREPEAYPAPQRALVLGDDVEAAWARSGLSDLGLDLITLGSEALGQALARATETRRDLIFAPGTLCEGLRQTGGPWRVVGPRWVGRLEASAAARASGLPTVKGFAIENQADLERALSSTGTPLQLVGLDGQSVDIPTAAGAAFQLALARQKLGYLLFAQTPVTSRHHVLVAGDGRLFWALGAFTETSVEGHLAMLSEAGPEELRARALGEAVARAVRLQGMAVVSLANDDGQLAFEAFLPSWGPGALAVEVRLGVSLIALAVDLVRGLALPPPVEPRGVACALEAPSGQLQSLANLRAETGDNGRVYVCAQGADAGQTVRKLARALKPPA